MLSAIYGLSAGRRGDFITPQPGGFSKILKINFFFSFRNCKKWCTKAQNAIISHSFPSYLNWPAVENPLDIGERARRDVGCRSLGGSQAVATSMNTTRYSFAIRGSLIFNDSDTFAAFLFQSSPRNRKRFITPPTSYCEMVHKPLPVLKG